MAIQTAEAKLYTGIRCWVVDKNISANLTSTFTTGNKNRPIESGDTVYPGILAYRLYRTTIDLEMVATINRVDERYKTYGGGNNVITTAGVDNTRNWKVTSGLVCKFPTYIQIDIEKLGLPEGTDCIVDIEEGWITEGDYPGSTFAPNPEVKNFFTFRTPWYGVGKLVTASSISVPRFRLRYSSSDVGALFTPNFNARANRVGKIDLDASSSIYAFYGRRRPFGIQMFARFGPIGPGDAPWLEGNGYPYGTGLGSWPAGFPGILRIRQATANFIYDSNASMSIEAYNLPFVWPLTNYSVVSNMVSDVDAFKGVGTPSLTSQTALNVSSRVDYNSFLAGIQSQSSIVCRPITNARANITAQSSLSCNAISNDDVILKIVVPSGTVGQRTFGFRFDGNVLVNIDWGDGVIDSNIETTGMKLHTYTNPGNYTVSISSLDDPPFGIPLEQWKIQPGQSLVINGVSTTINPPSMVRECLSFGKLNTINLTETFKGCTQLTKVPTFLPSTVQALWDTFNGCTQLNDSNVTLWNTVNVTNMSGTFDGCSTFNQNIGSWNTSNVTSMVRMFSGASSFNQNITGWNTSKVTSMAVMFSGATSFNQNIGSWDVSKVVGFSSMFLGATAFNGNIENWTINTSAAVTMYNMFNGATSFNRPIGSWNTGAVAGTGATSGMSSMFRNATAFNQNLSTWCVTNFPTKPDNFDTNTPAWVKTGRQPIWGTCP